MSSPTTAPRYSRHLLEEMPLLLPSQLLCNSIVSLHPFLPNPKNTNGFFSPLCCSSSTTTAAATAPTASTNAGAAPVIRKRKRYRKLCPGESKGIVEEMRFVTMRLYTNNNSSTTTTSNSNGNSGGDGDESGIEDNNNEFDDCDGVEETWMPTIEGFVKYLVDSELVFHTIERIVDESDNIAYTYFRQTGLERLESLSKDLEWLEQQGISIPEPSSPGVSYAQYLEELAEKSAPLFLCHFYNIYFAHISGGQVITKQVCEKLLEGKDLELCRWEGNVPELLKEVREKLNKLGEDIIIIKPPKKSPALLRMVVLMLSMVSGVYICSICLKQLNSYAKPPKLVTIQLVYQPCHSAFIEPWEIPYVHFPKPSTYNRGECSCNSVRFFAILSMQRSGSGWFETLLNSHINVSSNGEIFSVKERRANVSTIFQTMDKVYNLDWFSSASKNECSAAVGFKWMFNQGLMEHHQEIVKYFNRRGVSLIFLLRRNLLRRMISLLANSYDRDAKLLNGTHKSHVHSLTEAEILAKYKPTIDIKSMISNMKQVEETTQKALEFFKSTRHIVLYYEDLINDRTKLLDVQEFLRLPRRRLYSRQVKIHKGSLSDQIENWNEVNNTLNGTQYDRFLQQDYKM